MGWRLHPLDERKFHFLHRASLTPTGFGNNTEEPTRTELKFAPGGAELQLNTAETKKMIEGLDTREPRTQNGRDRGSELQGITS